MNMPQNNWSGTAADFVRHVLGEHPEYDFNEVRKLGVSQGLNIPPIIYGRIRKEIPFEPLAEQQGEELDAPPEAAPESDGAPHDQKAGDDGAASDAAPAQAQPPAFKRSKSPALDYAMSVLSQRPDATYQELKAHCDQHGWKLPPILYGRAKALLGQVPVRPRRSRKHRDAAEQTAEHKPTMRLRQVESVDAAAFTEKLENIRNFEQLVATVREIDAERRRLRELLERIVDMIDDTLG